MKAKPFFQLSGQIIDIKSGNIFSGTITVVNGKIKSVLPDHNTNPIHILPGLIDSHIHIESSMLIPSEFARLAVVHGTVATVSDPHEIANVLGMEGVEFMIENGKKVPFKFYFGAPSCVPATSFETSGAQLGAEAMDVLLSRKEIKYMAEMMNYPGVLFQDNEVMAKLDVAKKYSKPIDGHAPGLMGADAKKYIEAGISTDHECFTMEEAIEKIQFGMKIQIREGSAAKNFDALIGLINQYPDKVLLCSDDKHPDDLVNGHINLLVKRAIALGYDPIRVLQCCILNPVNHYQLEVGLLQEGHPADFIVVDNLQDFNVLQTYVDGILVAENGKTLIPSIASETPNKFVAKKIAPSDLRIQSTGKSIRIIEAVEGQLITNIIIDKPLVVEEQIVSDVSRDYLKMIVINRYNQVPIAFAFIKNFQLKGGALASTVAHDSHNIIAVGADDASMARAVNLLVDSQGGIAFVNRTVEHVLPLPVAGLMSAADGYEVAKAYEQMNALVLEAGCGLQAPLMTLSFMALLVIPQLKLSDKGLFDGNTFSFTSLEVD